MNEVDLDRLCGHVAAIAKSPRPAESNALESARQYVANALSEAGWTVSRHAFQATDDDGRLLNGVNLIARQADRSIDDPPRLCVGAHLDSRPDSPGADDNASAVAGLLEIARVIAPEAAQSPRWDLELVVFDLEENGMLGGTEHVRLTESQDVDLQGMVSLEMIAYCDPNPNSQSLPRPLVGLYPDTGDFIAIIGNQNSARLIQRFQAGMEQIKNLPVETLAVPFNGERLQATRLSDHSPFWDAGYPAVMITDTSFLRNPNYHTPSDTVETLDMPFLHRVTEGCVEAIRHILEIGRVWGQSDS